MSESQQQKSSTTGPLTTGPSTTGLLTTGLLTTGPSTTGPSTIPSLQFCLTGQIIPPERYHQDVHNYGRTIRQRAPQILDWYSTNEIEYWFNENKNWCETNLRPEQILEIYAIIYPIPMTELNQ